MHLRCAWLSSENIGHIAPLEPRQLLEKPAEKIANPQCIKLGKQEFLNAVKTAPDKMKAGSAAEKDVLCRILFLNLCVDNEKVVSYHWREPFASLVKATQLHSGGAEATSFERVMADLAQWFIDNSIPLWISETRQTVAYSENNYWY